MSKNKLAKFADMATYSNVFQYTFEQLQETGFPLKGNWHQNYFHNDNPIVVELGCGRGEYTVGLAKQFPEKNYIGIDIKGARMHCGATEALEKELKNVAFVRTHIELLSYFFAPNEVAEIWITFADPQMKKVNKRLTCTMFMERYSNILSPKGIVHLKSDSNFLVTYTEEMAKANDLRILASTHDLYHDNVASDIAALRDIQTYYESQWLGRGIPIKYLAIEIEKREKWIEPEVEIELDSYRSFGRDKRSALEAHK
ncbi:MAG: tRNA (guanosine(46)-N7)-methyltransferase TrmB [Bacteroidales bacterium]|nr:tRNA (guanosine(46)-N7)-methyltransferase TrmB [Bacteroidales bacterium]